MRAARSRGAVPATVGYTTLQAAVLPGPADALFLPLSIAHPRQAPALALATIVGGAIGSSIAWLIGAALVGAVAPELLDGALARLPFVDASFVAEARTFMQSKGWLFILISPVSPVSSKLMGYGAGIVGLPWASFVGVLTLGRVVRYLVLVTLIRRGLGDRLLEALGIDRATVATLSGDRANG